MSTKIEWATEVWNPVTGCTPISEGCQNCYAKRMAQRLKGRFGYPEDESFKVTFHPDKLDQPLKWKKPRRIFVVSMGDLFHENVPFQLIATIFGVMSFCQEHTFLVLTKRPYRMAEFFNDHHNGDYNRNFNWWLNEACYALPDNITKGIRLRPKPDKLPLPNVILGVSAENQPRADERIPILLQILAAKRFISIEPMLGPVDLDQTCSGQRLENGWCWRSDLDWVVLGSESGLGARPMHPDWVRSVRDQCQGAGVPFFFKQWGEWWPSGPRILENRRMIMFGNEPMYQIGKKQAGRLLDGRTWDEMP